MKHEPDGGPAFPATVEYDFDGKMLKEFVEGMALRDYFAARAEQSLLSAIVYVESGFLQFDPGEVARAAYAMADAMLEARKSLVPDARVELMAACQKALDYVEVAFPRGETAAALRAALKKALGAP
jgi:hypothetical protein